MAAEKIEGNYDILVDILVRLPPKSYFRFKAVSNRWKSILTDVYFLERYIARRNNKMICGGDDDIELERLLALVETTPLMNILPLDEKNIVNNIPNAFGQFLHSSNGLILCGTHTNKTYHILNPLTRKATALPPPPIAVGKPIMALVYEEDDNACQLIANYKVVMVCGSAPVITTPLQTYSSKTREWSITRFRIDYPDELCDVGVPPVVYNGVVHWQSCGWSILMYDSSRHHIHQDPVQIVFLPLIFKDRIDFENTNEVQDLNAHCCSFTRTHGDGVLWFSVTNKQGMRLWTLPKDEDGDYMYSANKYGYGINEWICTYIISWEFSDFLAAESNFFTIQALVSLNNTPAAILMDEFGIYIYNWKSSSLKLVHYHEHAQASSYPKYYPYMEGSSLSSYFLLDSVSY